MDPIPRRLSHILDRIAVAVSIWGLRRLYGADCETDIRDEHPDERCLSCDAARLIAAMEAFR